MLACPHGWQTNIEPTVVLEWSRLPEQCMLNHSQPRISDHLKRSSLILPLCIASISAVLWYLWLLNNQFLPHTHVHLYDCAHTCMPVCSIPVWCRVSSVLAGSVEAGSLWWVLRPLAACSSHPQCGVVGGLCRCAWGPAAHQQWWQLPQSHHHCQPPTQAVPAEER